MAHLARAAARRAVRLVGDVVPRGPHDAEPCPLEPCVAVTVTLERDLGGVEGVAVDLDDEAVVGPEEVELEAFHSGVGVGTREVGPADQLEQASRGLGAGEGGAFGEDGLQRSGPLPPGARSMRERSSRRRDEALSFGLGGFARDHAVLPCGQGSDSLIREGEGGGGGLSAHSSTHAAGTRGGVDSWAL